MSKEYLDEVHDALDVLRQAANDLSFMARAFAITGNDKVSDDLQVLAGDVGLSAKKVQDAVSKELNRQCAESREFAGQTVRLALNHIMGETA